MSNHNLIPLVKEEARRLRIHATPKELSRLNFEKLNPEASDLCIYGQMTGDCYSLRASELIVKCADRPFSERIHSYTPIPVWSKKLQSRILRQLDITRDGYSPIEYYIAQSGSKNKELIDYLQGRVPELNL